MDVGDDFVPDSADHLSIVRSLIDRQIWKVQKVRAQHKPTFYGKTWDFYYMVYRTAGTPVLHFYVCGSKDCLTLMFVDFKNSGNSKLTRHKCYRDYMSSLRSSNNGVEEENDGSGRTEITINAENIDDGGEDAVSEHEQALARPSTSSTKQAQLKNKDKDVAVSPSKSVSAKKSKNAKAKEPKNIQIKIKPKIVTPKAKSQRKQTTRSSAGPSVRPPVETPRSNETSSTSGNGNPNPPNQLESSIGTGSTGGSNGKNDRKRRRGAQKDGEGSHDENNRSLADDQNEHPCSPRKLRNRKQF